jgi:threonine dehydrogenase-like Zn-dependent dehydrogenase
MFEDLKNALGKAETKGDVAVVLGAGTLGAAIDLIVSAHGAPSPGVVSALSASGALAAKKGWEARKDAKRAKKAAEDALGKVKEAPARAQRILDFFEQQGYDNGVEVMHTQLDWHTQHIIDDEQLDQAVEAARNDFLAWVKRGRQATPQDIAVEPAD